MQKILWAMTGLIVSLLINLEASALDHSHKAWTNLLSTYQTADGLVRYQKLKADIAADAKHPFLTYLKDLQAVSESEFNGWSKDDQKAFLINAYNALTVKLIVDNYPVKSIKKIGGLFKKPWGIEFFSLLGGKIKSLDPIEHEWLRPMYKDYRIHAAVNCASISCPPLRREAFLGARLNAQLDDQMQKWLADKTRNQIDASAKVFKLSKIFDWYKKDFETWGSGVVPVVMNFIKPPLDRSIASQVKIEYLDYDWNLNEAK